MFDYDEIANLLGDGPVLLSRAERISKAIQKGLSKKAYVAGARKEYAAAKLDPPSEADLDRNFKKTHSSLQATLGRIYLLERKTAKSESLLNAAYAENPDNSVAAANLGMLAAEANKRDEALTYLTRAQLTGKLDGSQQKRMEDLYAERHGESTTGFEDYLDQRYEALFPIPFSVVGHSPATKSERTVLAELLTGAGCEPCIGADLVIDADLERYSRKEVAVLAFDQHIPEPDPLANPDSVKRFGFYDAEGTPTLALDGSIRIIGSDRYDAKKQFEETDKLIKKALESPPEANIMLTNSRQGDRIEVRASVANVKSTSKDLKLQIALAENRVRYSGENGIRFHPMVVRSFASAECLSLKSGKGCDLQHVFDIQKISAGLKTYLDAYEKSNEEFGPIVFIQEMYTIDANQLAVIAFLQDAKTKHVLQASYAAVTNSQ